MSSKPDVEDVFAQAAKAIADQDLAAFKIVFKRLFPLLLAAPVVRGMPVAEAEELVQETLHVAWTKGMAAEDLRPWMYRVLKNRAIARYRRTKRAERSYQELKDEPLDPVDTALDYLLELEGRNQLDEAVREALDRIPDKQRKALELDKAGVSMAETARILEINTNALYALRHRGHRNFLAALKSIFRGRQADEVSMGANK